MQHEEKQPTAAEQPHAFTLLCDDNAIANRVLHNLASLGFQHCEHAPILIIFGTSHGFALRALLSLDQRPAYVVAATRNQCPEYLEDVWEHAPDILLAGPQAERELPAALFHVTNGRHYRTGVGAGSAPTPAERRVLRLLAFGREVPQIANDLHLAQQTVRNTLSSIYQKLDLKGQVQAALYYWDKWKFIEDAPIGKLTITPKKEG